ncbi:cold shock domain-containing protein [Vibrio tapetis subsp. quintayensis]|uniref:cold-shock protein n=1 Tax=Vibrio tapetis TaxID=52443 RepID=UPI0025B4D1BC|nr:cold shock domain-containing protein [Vibrio tapetis]MDN3680949.1 cold shock domain-containing protein [Vibrio tapetis subsp. quintayensis]
MVGLKAKITWFNKDKKFGFAVPDALPVDVLIELSDMSIPHLDLTIGQRVYIEVESQCDGAFQATSLIPL